MDVGPQLFRRYRRWHLRKGHERHSFRRTKDLRKFVSISAKAMIEPSRSTLVIHRKLGRVSIHTGTSTTNSPNRYEIMQYTGTRTYSPEFPLTLCRQRESDSVVESELCVTVSYRSKGVHKKCLLGETIHLGRSVDSNGSLND